MKSRRHWFILVFACAHLVATVILGSYAAQFSSIVSPEELTSRERTVVCLAEIFASPARWCPVVFPPVMRITVLFLNSVLWSLVLLLAFHVSSKLMRALTTRLRGDGCGRSFVCGANSPDGDWSVKVYGSKDPGDCFYAYARCTDGLDTSFPLGPDGDRSQQIAFRWNLPNESWGIFIDGQCWAIYTYRPALRMDQRRFHSRSGPNAHPYTDEEIKFTCAKRRGQYPGTKGFVIEE